MTSVATLGLGRVPTFSYASLPEPLADELQERAKAIRNRISRQTQDIIEMGADLLAVREKLEHGQFYDWLAVEFGMTDRTAQNYMRAREWAEDKSEIISVLPPTAVYLLSRKSTPEDIQDKVVADAKAGKPVKTKEVEHLIWEAKVVANEAKRLAPKSVEQRARDRRRKERQRKEHEKWEAEQEREKAEGEAAAEQIGQIMKKYLPPDQLNEVRQLLQNPRVYFSMLIDKLM